jgi:hypothetical protein
MKTKNLFPKIKNAYILTIGIVLGISIFISVNAAGTFTTIMNWLATPSWWNVIWTDRWIRVHNFLNMRSKDASNTLQTLSDLVISWNLQIIWWSPASWKFLKAIDTNGNSIRESISGIQWATWATWATWAKWDQWIPWVWSWTAWATWPAWPTWLTWPIWPRWATWTNWTNWINWATWTNWTNWINWATWATWLLQVGTIWATPFWNGSSRTTTNTNIFNTGWNVGIWVSSPFWKFQVWNSISSISLWSAPMWATAAYMYNYVWFNAARNSAGQWFLYSDGSNNGWATIMTNAVWSMYFSTIPGWW